MDQLPPHQQRASTMRSHSSSMTSSSGGQAVNMVGASSTSVYPSSASTPTGSSNPTTGRDQQVEKLLKEVKHLKQKVDLLDKENIALKKSIYDLSARYAASISQGGLTYRPFVVDHGSTSNMDSKAEQVISKAVQEAAGNDFQPSKSLDIVDGSFTIDVGLDRLQWGSV